MNKQIEYEFNVPQSNQRFFIEKKQALQKYKSYEKFYKSEVPDAKYIISKLNNVNMPVNNLKKSNFGKLNSNNCDRPSSIREFYLNLTYDEDNDNDGTLCLTMATVNEKRESSLENNLFEELNFYQNYNL
jgi:hypothetical protein